VKGVITRRGLQGTSINTAHARKVMKMEGVTGQISKKGGGEGPLPPSAASRPIGTVRRRGPRKKKQITQVKHTAKPSDKSGSAPHQKKKKVCCRLRRRWRSRKGGAFFLRKGGNKHSTSYGGLCLECKKNTKAYHEEKRRRTFGGKREQILRRKSKGKKERQTALPKTSARKRDMPVGEKTCCEPNRQARGGGGGGSHLSSKVLE